MADIFLSYAREDTAQARRLAQALESHGWSVWWDQRIKHGHNFAASIQKQLDDARCIAVLWSKASIASSFVLDEATEGKDGRLVPLLIEKVKQPLGFRQFQAADLTDWTGQTPHDEFGLLLESIAALVPPSPAAAPPEAVPSRAATPEAVPSSASAPPPSDVDVYICYMHLDDVALVEGRPGWVRNFGRALQIRLSQLLGRPAIVSMSAATVDDESGAEGPLNAIRRAACLVAVVSPRFVRSESAQPELAEFLSAADQHGGVMVGTRSRLFKVLKMPVASDALPPTLQPLIGYEFFKIDSATGKVRAFDDLFGQEANREFWLRLDDLASDIESLIQEYRESGSQGTIRNP